MNSKCYLPLEVIIYIELLPGGISKNGAPDTRDQPKYSYRAPATRMAMTLHNAFHPLLCTSIAEAKWCAMCIHIAARFRSHRPFFIIIHIPFAYRFHIIRLYGHARARAQPHSQYCICPMRRFFIVYVVVLFPPSFFHSARFWFALCARVPHCGAQP